jgi:hypothetical protein
LKKHADATYENSDSEDSIDLAKNLFNKLEDIGEFYEWFEKIEYRKKK